MKTALSIAGSDSCGGAGIQADIKTMTMNGVYAMSAVTALTAQNTTGVRAIQEATPDFLRQQIDAVFEDIRPDAVKIGMVSSSELINVIADALEEHNAANIVVDPVMVATSGSSLMKTDAVQTLMDRLLPIATVITPNIPEAQVLSGLSIENEDDMLTAAKAIGDRYGCAVLLKGGHSVNDANDLLYTGDRSDQEAESHSGSAPDTGSATAPDTGSATASGSGSGSESAASATASGSGSGSESADSASVSDAGFTRFEGKRINNPNTHGTGCTLSSAIASNLAKGYDLITSIRRAKAYISGALGAMLDLGSGSGPMNHAFDLQGEFAEEI